MNIDIESISLIGLILQDTPKNRQFILCILARSNSIPARISSDSNTEYPTFYGYSNGKIPFYLVSKGVISVVPREGYTEKIISSYNLSLAETVINKVKDLDIHQKLKIVFNWMVLENKTTYRDAKVFLIFRDKALGYIRNYAIGHKDEILSFLGPELSKELGFDAQKPKNARTEGKDTEEPRIKAKTQGAMGAAAERFVEKREEEESKKILQKVPDLEKRLIVVEQQSQTRKAPKQTVKEILKQYKFPKMQKKLINKLVNMLPKDTKTLKTEVGTNDLSSLKRDTLATIKKQGLSPILVIKSYKGGFDSHFYQMELILPSITKTGSKN